jgi:hypothetical protein
MALIRQLAAIKMWCPMIETLPVMLFRNAVRGVVRVCTLSHGWALGALAAGCCFAAQVADAAPKRFADWATINNPRLGFSIAYPTDVFVPIDAPTGVEGRVLQSADGKAKLLVATFENTDKLTLGAYRDYLLSTTYAEAKIDYGPVKQKWFVLSGTRGDTMIYERVTLTCGGALINSWAMVYPTAERKFYDRVVEAVARTYTAGAGPNGSCRDIGSVSESVPVGPSAGAGDAQTGETPKRTPSQPR